MSYLLDTNIVLYQFADIPDAVSLVSRLAPQGIAMSIITYMELYQSTLRAPDPAHAQAQLRAYLSSVPVLPFSDAEARQCATLRQDLAAQGKRVRPRALDLLIAATALENDLTLVTRNHQDFDDIPGLKTHFYQP